MITGGQPLALNLDPRQALAHWPSDHPVVMLHSARPHPRWSRYTLLAEPTGAYHFDGNHSRWIGSDSPPITWTHRPFRDLHAVLDSDADAMWVGYFSYDIARWVEALPTVAAQDRDWPIVQFQRCPGFLIHDNTDNRWTAHGRYIEHPPVFTDHPQALTCQTQGRAVAFQPRDEYEQSIARAIEYIATGDIFQVNLAQRFTAAINGSPRKLFDKLIRASPAWYAAYLELMPSDACPTAPRRTICSASPELFLIVSRDGRVVTRPIKGTRPASVSPEVLRASAKDTAELTMIVDLLRNDLGRVCDCGSVRVEHAREIESHPTVHHGVATITGQLHRTRTLIDLLRATLPGGSITGAPKVRAMQIIDELEPVRRGPYCGAIGFVHGGATRPTAQFNLAIRTLLLDQNHTGQGQADFSVGGGIIADSTPSDEYRETLDKAVAMLRALE